MTRVRDWLPPKVWGLGYHAHVAKARLDGSYRELRRTAALRDRFAGQRAFVVGNGASLRDLDLGRLRGEHVVTMNTFFEHRERFGIVPTAHVFLDDWYFADGKEQLRRYEAQRGDTLTFVPLQARAQVRDLVPGAHYFFPAGAFEHNRNLDLCRPIPFFQTVAQPALLVALHLGFDPIYFVGCDIDMLSHVVAVNPLRVRVPYFYDEAEPKLETLPYDYTWYAGAIRRMHEGFSFLRDELPRGRRVLNAGKGGLVEAFPRVDFESLF